MAYPVEDIANLLLVWAEQDNDPMSNMKLQKMLYYQQGFHLAYFDSPLFDDEIEAWMYGPVVPKIYNLYKSAGKNILHGDKERNFPIEDEMEEKLFWEVYQVYNKFSASGLMQKTHQEMPWCTTPQGEGNVIEKSKIQIFFKTKLA